ncbi:MAG TPA: helix-turn-helix transcriptional regulator [Symbiobacteriaceae bacterium]|nr:helix-turn-helix transcriptional regulator [Symbiobacteriaceae bacterium]
MPLSRGQRLRRLREQRQEEIKQVAPAMGISRGYLSLLERDLKGHHLDHVRGTLERIAAYYGVLPEYFLAETPQEYVSAYVRRLSTVPDTVGGRLALVLNELELRWGEDEYGPAKVASKLGTTTEMLTDLVSDKIQVTDTVAQQISTLTGAPVEWLVPRDAPAPDPTAPFERAFKLAVESGMQPNELEALIQVWLTAQNMKKPSG